MKEYLKMSDKWMKTGIRCQIINDKTRLREYGLDEIAGQSGIIIRVEQSPDPGTYSGLVARLSRDGQLPQDYVYWVPPTMMNPI